MEHSQAEKKKNVAQTVKALAPGAIGLGVAALAAMPATAATLTVTNLNDAGAGSLRDTINQANGAAGADVVTFQPGLTGTITLTTGQLAITDSVDVQGPGEAVLTVSGNDASRVFYLYSNATVLDISISGLTVTHGLASAGAGIVDFDENLTLNHVTLTNNHSTGDGGGLSADGFNMTLTVRNSTLSGNVADGDGGGIYVEDTGGPMTIADSVISSNQAAGSGGGIYLYDPDQDILIQRTTISGNTAGNLGGGIYLYSFDNGGLTIDASTISGNSASAGGGMFLYGIDTSALLVRNTTISGNQATVTGGGVYLYNVSVPATFEFATITNNSDIGIVLAGTGGTVTLDNTIVADNSITDVIGSTFAVNYSLVEAPTSSAFIVGPGFLTAVDPQLGPLANNGGPTQTQRPALTSPVVNAANPVTAVLTDQRGQPRSYPTRADMGALELVGGVIQFNPQTYTVAENGGSTTLTVVRDVGPDSATVDYTTTPGTATAGSDYTTASGILTFAPGELSKTFNVPILDDTTVEPSEQFTATLSNPSADATIGAANPATVTITDFEPGALQFNAATANVNENAGTVTITVTRANGSDGAVSASYTTSNGSATAGSDYTTTSGTVNFAAGDSAPKSFTVPITNDVLIEGNETFNVTLSAPTGGAALGSPSNEVVTIIDGTIPGTVQFSTAVTSVAESAGSVTLTVTRTGGTGGPITVTYTTGNGTAAAPSDYTASTGTVTFANGDATPKTIVIPIISDAVPEPPETFTVTLSNPTAGALGTISTETVTITPPLQEIPALGPIGRLLLALSTMASALWVMGRRRLFGFLFAAVMIGTMAGTLHAAPATAPASRKDTPVRHAKGAHAPANLTKTKIRGTLVSVQSTDKSVTLQLAGRAPLTLPTSQLSVSLRGDDSTVAALGQGQHVTVVTLTDKSGNIVRVKVKVH
ncbi:MAG TPA: Calx-beta domain-containing protein [Thermoanaerobaculia bacterium]|nr:Calx-beta domain-containing protein [Thermoanaerobaculia bacterium]